MAKIGSQKCWFLLKIVRFSEKSIVLLFTKVGLYCADRENVRVCRFGGLSIAGACGSPKILVGGILHGPGRKPKCTLRCARHAQQSVGRWAVPKKIILFSVRIGFENKPQKPTYSAQCCTTSKVEPKETYLFQKAP